MQTMGKKAVPCSAAFHLVYLPALYAMYLLQAFPRSLSVHDLGFVFSMMKSHTT